MGQSKVMEEAITKDDVTYAVNAVSHAMNTLKTIQVNSRDGGKISAFDNIQQNTIGGLVHDYMYKYTACKPSKKGSLLIVDQKRADQIFRDINIEVNGFYFMNYLAYWSLRIGGFVAWNGHRKRNAKIK